MGSDADTEVMGSDADTVVAVAAGFDANDGSLRAPIRAHHTAAAMIATTAMTSCSKEHNEDMTAV